MKPTRAVLLVRISDDKAQDAKGVARQEEDGRVLAVRLGWTITEVVVENDTSAFKRRRIKLPDGSTGLRTARPGFRSIIDKLASGECDGLLAYDLDRTARDPRDLEDLIDVVESRQPRIPVESVSGSLRLANDADITMARVMVAIANKSSRDTGRRVARKHEELAKEGKWNGGGFRGYGFDTAGHKPIPAETKILVEIGDRVLGEWDGWTDEQRAAISPEVGESLNSIAADLERREVPTVTGAPWSGRSVGTVVSKPSVAGLRVYRGEVVGAAEWGAIIPEERWERVCARITGRAGNADLTLQRWLTGVLKCPLCGHMLSGSHGNSGVRYWCATPAGGCGKIAIKAEPAEEEIARQVLDLLSKSKVLTRLQHVSLSEVTAEARAELADDEAQLKELAGMWARKEITFAEYGEARRIIEKRVRESRALITSAAPRVLRQLLAGDVHASWSKLEPYEKREVVLALVPGYHVLPFDKTKARRFDPTRLVPIKDE
ncbi:recombinase family protein [Streptomyces sp. NPDC005279]|uniref:recombinase family protein n=1 Tax=Streptomyces sp. NPDC005279 TaxID=3364712 RepID=UPI00369666CB